MTEEQQFVMVRQDPDRIQIGDIVRHGPSGQEWCVAFADYEEGRMSAWGWPESVERLENVTLVRKASQEQYLEWKPKLLENDGYRYRRARRLYVIEVPA